MKKNFEIQKLRVVTDIKQQIVKEEDGLVITKVDYSVKIPKDIARLSTIIDYPPLGFWTEKITGSCTGISVLNKEDKWDLEKGLAISKARAEANAYRQAANRTLKLWRRLTAFNDAFTNLTLDLQERAIEVVNHNNSYIDSIAGK